MKKILFSAALAMAAFSANAQNAAEAKSLFDSADEEIKKSVLSINNPLVANKSNVAIIQSVDKATKIIDAYPDDVKQIADKAEQKLVKDLKKKREKYVSSALSSRSSLIPGAHKLLSDGTNYEDALEFLSVYINSAEMPMFASKNLAETDTMMATAGYLALFAINKVDDKAIANKNDKVISFATYAAKNADFAEMALSNLATSWRDKGDTVKFVSYLKEGFKQFPKQEWFSRQLADYYINSGKTEEGLAALDELIAVDAESYIAYYLKGCLYFNASKYQNSVDAFDKAISLKPEEGQTYRDGGQAYLNLAQEYLDKNQRATFKDAKVKAWMDKAEGYFLKLKEKFPDEPAKWSVFLYRIYYNLYGESDSRTQEMQKLAGY
ncbi:MAG: hypothetical protein IKR18_10585 [Bacteroidaceae bacterium]|nr:hypothetical protein [Bacteroidaceae bacterium]